MTECVNPILICRHQVRVHRKRDCIPHYDLSAHVYERHCYPAATQTGKEVGQTEKDKSAIVHIIRKHTRTRYRTKSRKEEALPYSLNIIQLYNSVTKYSGAAWGGRRKASPYGWTSINYVICVSFHCHGTSSYEKTNTKPYKFPMHCSKCDSFWGTSYSRPPIDLYLTFPPVTKSWRRHWLNCYPSST